MSKKDVVLRLDDELAKKVEAHRRAMSEREGGRQVPRTEALQNLIEYGLGIASAASAAAEAAYSQESAEQCVWFFCVGQREHRTLRESLECAGACS